MADSSNQERREVWPSFETAARLYDLANTAFIASLVIGVAATVLLVWMGNVKEGYLRRDVAGAGERAAEAEARASEANARALEAKVALERFKAPRLLTPDQQQEVARKISSFRNTPFDMSVTVGDPEALTLVLLIGNALQSAGWKWVEWNHPTGPFMNVYTISDLPNIGQGGGIGTGAY
jgi:hypothetical protein